MNNANGRFDFAVRPTELRSGAFKLWSVNLVLALVPLIDIGGASQVNCIVGRFDLNNGDLTGDKIMIDTSAVRIRGEGQANLVTEELAFVFRPRAKGLAATARIDDLEKTLSPARERPGPVSSADPAARHRGAGRSTLRPR